MTFDANILYFVVDIINFEVVASILLFVYTNSFIIINGNPIEFFKCGLLRNLYD